MIVCIMLVAIGFLFAPTNGAGEPFSYDTQGAWPGVCVQNNNGRQSPINFQTSTVRENSSLIPLEFNGWTTPVNGEFRSAGHNVQFDPIDRNSTAVTTRTHLGTYRALQMHMHWGRNDQEGSEHRVNSQTYPLEMHIVHAKVGATDMTASDFYAVVGVFAQAVQNMEISGVWAQLNASAVQTYPTTISVPSFVYNNLLPSSREYYHYVGSLTTPGCDEVVQWFVLKDPIQVPAAYLTYLRQVESSNANETLNFNFREVQPLGQRSVYQVAESGAPKMILSNFLILSSVLLLTMTMYFS